MGYPCPRWPGFPEHALHRDCRSFFRRAVKPLFGFKSLSSVRRVLKRRIGLALLASAKNGGEGGIRTLG